MGQQGMKLFEHIRTRIVWLVWYHQKSLLMLSLSTTYQSTYALSNQ